MNKKFFDHNQSVIGTKVFIDRDKNEIKKFIKHECSTNEKLIDIYEKYISDWVKYKYFLPSRVHIDNEYLVVTQ